MIYIKTFILRGEANISGRTKSLLTMSAFFFFFIVISESQIKAKGQAPTVVNRAREWSCVFQTVELWVMSIRAQRKHPDFAVTVPETLNWCVFMAQGAVSRLSVVLCPPGRRLTVPCLSGAKANVG